MPASKRPAQINEDAVLVELLGSNPPWRDVATRVSVPRIEGQGEPRRILAEGSLADIVTRVAQEIAISRTSLGIFLPDRMVEPVSYWPHQFDALIALNRER